MILINTFLVFRILTKINFRFTWPESRHLSAKSLLSKTFGVQSEIQQKKVLILLDTFEKTKNDNDFSREVLHFQEIGDECITDLKGRCHHSHTKSLSFSGTLVKYNTFEPSTSQPP